MGMGEVGLTLQCVRTGAGGLLWVATAGSTKCGVLSQHGLHPPEHRACDLPPGTGRTPRAQHQPQGTQSIDWDSLQGA